MSEFDGDAESAERSKLLREVRMVDYLSAAEASTGITGRAREVNEALEVPIVGAGGGVSIPWEVLAGPETRRQGNGNGEQRAFSTTTQLAGGIAQRPVLATLVRGFNHGGSWRQNRSSIPAGRAEWPLLTAGVEPAQVEEGTAAAAAVALPTFSTEVLKPKRLTWPLRVQS